MRAGRRKGLEESDPTGRLEVRNALQAVLDEGFRRVEALRLSLLQHDTGQHLFLPQCVGGRYHRDLLDRRMLDQHRLNLCRGNVLPGTPDHVLDSIDEDVSTVLLAPRNIAGVEPAAAPRSFR